MNILSLQSVCEPMKQDSADRIIRVLASHWQGGTHSRVYQTVVEETFLGL